MGAMAIVILNEGVLKLSGQIRVLQVKPVSTIAMVEPRFSQGLEDLFRP
jgi:hypothetical protein